MITSLGVDAVISTMSAISRSFIGMSASRSATLVSCADVPIVKRASSSAWCAPSTLIETIIRAAGGTRCVGQRGGHESIARGVRDADGPGTNRLLRSAAGRLSEHGNSSALDGYQSNDPKRPIC